MNQGRSDKIAVFLLKATAQKPMNEKRIETPSAVQSYEEKLFPDFKIFSLLSCYSSANPFYPWDDLISS